MLVRISFVIASIVAAAAHAQNTDGGKPAFREIYQEMVEIDS